MKLPANWALSSSITITGSTGSRSRSSSKSTASSITGLRCSIAHTVKLGVADLLVDSVANLLIHVAESDKTMLKL